MDAITRSCLQELNEWLAHNSLPTLKALPKAPEGQSPLEHTIRRALLALGRVTADDDITFSRVRCDFWTPGGLLVHWQLPSAMVAFERSWRAGKYARGRLGCPPGTEGAPWRPARAS